MERMRDARPDMALSGDFIVGFPGETEQDFQDTMALVREVGYASAYSFKYSARPGTPAAEKDDKMVEHDVAMDRLHRLQALISAQQYAFQDSMVGRDVSVLFEKKGRLDGQMIGKSEYLHAVHAAVEDVEIGDIRRVRITQSKTNSLEGQLID
jgi:tRNA-2-methylthio-N6-dimethylallyladenosine synthase